MFLEYTDNDAFVISPLSANLALLVARGERWTPLFVKSTTGNSDSLPLDSNSNFGLGPFPLTGSSGSCKKAMYT